MNEDWPELNDLAAQVSEMAAQGWQRSTQMRAQASGLALHAQGLAEQFAALGVDVCLRQLNERLLSGLGSVEFVEGGMGIERVAALVWPADIHPQPPDETAADDGVYRIEVWLGPSLQDGKLRLRIAGTKRLEAVLPTTPDRFRSALLSVFQNPLFVPHPESVANDATEIPDDDRLSNEREVSDDEDEAT